MTQTTDHSPPPFPRTPVPVQGSRRPALTACLVRGATAAGLGMGALTVLVMTVWISAPYPDDGPEGALHAAAALWLLSHGTGLVRADTLSGQPAPIGVVPLLLVALPLCLIHRAARDGLAPDTHGRRPRPSPLGAFCAVSLGYLLVAAVITVYAAGGSPAPDPLSTLAHLPLVTVAAAAAGVWTARGRPGGPLPRWLPEAVRVWLARTRVTVALRSAAAAVLVLVGGGALLVAAGLVGHADAAQDTFLHLSGGWSGRLAVLLLALALVPNAAVWGASYGLGPGFALGTEATATPLVVTGDPALPPFPLVAAVPSEGPGTPLNWAALAVPVLAALVVAAFTAARAAPRFQDRELAWSVWDTAAAALLAAVGCGVLTAVLSAAAGGPLGTERLAEFGPVWWLTGPAAFCWIAVVAVPLAVAVRIWRVLLARLTGAGMGMGFKGLRGSRARASAETPMSRASAETPMSRTPARTPMSRASAQSPGSGPPAETPVSRASAETPRSLRPPRPPSTPESLQPTDVSPEAPDTSEAPASPASPESSGTPEPSGPPAPPESPDTQKPQKAPTPPKAQKASNNAHPPAAPAAAPAPMSRPAEPPPVYDGLPARPVADGDPPPPWAVPASPWPTSPTPWGTPPPGDRPAAPPPDRAAEPPGPGETEPPGPGETETPGPDEPGPGGE